MDIWVLHLKTAVGADCRVSKVGGIAVMPGRGACDRPNEG